MAQTALRRGSQEEGNSDYFTGCPIGGGFLWFGLPTKIPSNCMICDNSTLAIANFAKLHENLGGAWGTSGANLNIPDLRGRFPRGVDGAASRDPDKALRTTANTGGNSGNAVGSVQDDALQNISGDIIDVGNRHTRDVANGPFDIVTTTSGYVGEYGATSNYRKINFNASRVARTSTETRPANANVYFVIRVS